MKKIFTNSFCVSAILFSLFSGITNAQEKIIVRGTVTDKSDKSAVVGATVIEMDSDKRTIGGVATDLNGNFALKISNPKNKIVISMIGFRSIMEEINNRSIINVRLEQDIKQLDVIEVVAEKKISSGVMEVAERDLTTAVARINADELAEIQATSIDQALQGRLTGVDIVANSGDPGAGMSIRIRGTSSINSSSDPLIIVDNMPYDTDISSDFNFATADAQGYAQLLNIAPSDIQDITVLKDAAATAVWGSRASNGVLVINTKRGARGKPVVNYTFRGTLKQQPSPIPMLSGDQYAMLIPEAYMNRNGSTLNTINVKEFQYDPNDSYWYNNYSHNTDWIEEITQIGHEHDHNLSLSGGGEKARYRVSVNYNGQQGTTIGTAFSRITSRVNLDYTVSNKISFQTDLSYVHIDNDRNYVNSKDNADGVRSVAYLKMPNMGVYEEDENGNVTPNYFSPASNVQGSWSGTYNPVALARTGKNKVLGDRIIPKFNLQYQITPTLRYTFDVQFDINNNKNTLFLPQVATGRPVTETTVNRASDSDLDKFSVQTNNKLIYTPKLGEKHSLIALLSFQTHDYKEFGYGVSTSNTASSELQDPSVPSRTQNEELSLQSGASQNRSLGALLNIQYGLLDRYIINVGIRRDGNSKFGANHRFGDFPTLSGRWRVSGEPFMESLTFIKDFSLRASYGQSGNAPKASYGYYATYSNFDWNYLGLSSIYPRSMELKNLKWETVIQQNFGANLELFNGKINLDFDVYKKRTRDLFYQGLQISSFSGFDKVDMNVGIMDNQGWEIGLFTTPVKKKNLTVNFSVNISRNINVIREISEYYPRTRGNLTANGQYLITIQENNPFGSFYGYRYKGVYKDAESTTALDRNGQAIKDPNGQPIPTMFYYPVVGYVFQPGDAQYEDINHDGNINYMDVVLLGDSNPKLQGGFGPAIQYKRLKINAFFNFRYGNDLVNETKMRTENMYGYSNQSTAVLRRWRNSGDETNIPRAVLGSGFNWLGSDRYVEDGSFMRLKYVTISYTLKKAWLDKLRAKDLNVYITAENLYTLTNYTGQDPEVTLKGSDPFKIGFDGSMTPPTKTVTVGLNVRF